MGGGAHRGWEGAAGRLNRSAGSCLGRGLFIFTGKWTEYCLRALFQKKELTEFCAKLGEFCEKLGEFVLAHKY